VAESGAAAGNRRFIGERLPVGARLRFHAMPMVVEEPGVDFGPPLSNAMG